MISENQELEIAQARVDNIQQRISFRDKGRAGNLRTELSKAKAIRDKIAYDVNRRSGDLTETNELIKYALEVKEKFVAVEKESNEFGEKLKAFSLYMDYLTKEKPEKVFSEIGAIKPVFTEIGREMIKNRQVEKVLTKAQSDFNSAKTKSENTSPVGKSGRTRQLTIARNTLKLAKFDVGHLPQLIEFYELRAEARWLDTVNTEKEEQFLERQAYITELEAEFALMEKHGFIQINS